MIRFRLAFNENNEQHMKAFTLLSEKPTHQKSNFIVSCILAYEDGKNIQSALSQALSGVNIKPQPEKKIEDFEKTQSRSDLPSELLGIDW